jgi:uncharacterized SAM-binding protein YcdF (DUF218 family)
MTRPVILQPPSTSPDPTMRFGWRDVRRRLPSIGAGAIAGALAGFLVLEFGLSTIFASLELQVAVLVSALAGALLGGFRQQRYMMWFDAVLGVLYLVIANTPLMYNVAGGWVRNDPMEPGVDAIIVLSARVNSDGFLSDQGVQRLLTGIELYQSGVAPRLFTTAVEATYGSVIRSSTGDQARLVQLGGARPAWASLTGVASTRDEAVQAASQLPTGAHSVAVVTTPMHTRRACATFEAVGFHVVCVASREQDYVAWHPQSARDRMESFRQYLYERLGMVKYRMKGWLPEESRG